MTDDWKAEAFAAYVANLQRQETAESIRLANEGAFTVYLTLAPGEPPVSDSQVQLELAAFSSALHRASIESAQRAVAFDSVEAHGFPLAEFVIKGLAVPMIPALAGLAAGWINARLGRKVRVRAGEVEVEAANSAEAEQLLKLAVETLERQRQAPAPHPPKDDASASGG